MKYISTRGGEAQGVSSAYAIKTGLASDKGLFMPESIPALTLGEVADISIYDTNRKLLLSELTKYGFEVVKPDGAFYLFMKSPSGDGEEMSERAKKHDLLIVPSESFGTAGFVRISYCVKTEQIERALPAFKALAEEYFGDKK